MTALSQAIKFRALIDKLSDTEFTQFTSNLLSIFGRSILVTSIFHHFAAISNIQNDANQQKVYTTINIIKNIINSRKIKPKPLEMQPVTINSLPSELFGEIGSYLHQKHNISLNQTNREIYIGCNTPNTLKHLDLTKVNDYSAIDIHKYPQIEYFGINLITFHTLKLPPSDGHIICNHLKQLTLSRNGRMNRNINDFMVQKSINFNNIKQLNLIRFGERRHKMDIQMFYELLSKFAMIEYLTVSRIILSVPVHPLTNLKQILPNLQGFASITRNNSVIHHIINPIFEAFGINLKAISFMDSALIQIPSDVIFCNLEELRILCPTISRLNDILKTAKNLRKVLLWNPSKFITNIELKNVLSKLLSDKEKLEYLFVHEIDGDNFKSICDGIKCGLVKMRETRTNGNIKIDILFAASSLPETNEIMLRASEILNELKLLNINNFLFRCRFNKIGDQNLNNNDWKEKYAKFRKQHKLKCKGYVTKHSKTIIMTNKECTIDGFSESWLIDQISLK